MPNMQCVVSVDFSCPFEMVLNIFIQYLDKRIHHQIFALKPCDFIYHLTKPFLRFLDYVNDINDNL